jgi:hypothetical protein
MFRLLLAAGLFAGLYTGYALIYNYTGGFPPDFPFSAARYGDMTLLYSIVPAYFFAASTFIRTRSDNAYQSLRSELSDPDSIQRNHFVRTVCLVVGGVIGFLYGFLDFQLTETKLQGAVLLQMTVKVGNGFVWCSIGMVLAWRLADAWLFNKLGENIHLDLLDLHKVKPIGRVASLDVLVVMGALALMPLQTMSTEFRWVFFEQGFVVGIPAALVLLLAPQFGVHRNIKALKIVRLNTLQNYIDAVDRDDIVALEPLLAHRERIDELSAWPIDTKVLRRALLYLVVPPLAWVGAAIVERGMDQFF